MRFTLLSAVIVVLGFSGQCGARQDFQFVAESVTEYFDGETGEGTLSQVISIVELPSTGSVHPSSGFSMAFEYDGMALNAVDVVPYDWLATVCGGGPEFFDVQFAVGGCDSGVTVSVVYGFFCTATIDHTIYTESLLVTYQADSSVTAGASSPVVAEFTFGDSCGFPPIQNVVVHGGASVFPTFVDATLTMLPIVPVEYVSGDCNGDGSVDLADPIWSWAELFERGPAALCVQSCDANGDSVYDISDSIFLLSYLFQGGAPPVAPFPQCASDLDPVLGCIAYSSCL